MNSAGEIYASFFTDFYPNPIEDHPLIITDTASFKSECQQVGQRSLELLKGRIGLGLNCFQRQPVICSVLQEKMEAVQEYLAKLGGQPAGRKSRRNKMVSRKEQDVVARLKAKQAAEESEKKRQNILSKLQIDMKIGIRGAGDNQMQVDARAKRARKRAAQEGK